jgi:hypothetical protein
MSLADLFTAAVAQGMHAPFDLDCEYWGREYAEKAEEIVVPADQLAETVAELQRIAVTCDNGAKPEDKLEFIRRVARPFLHHPGGQ